VGTLLALLLFRLLLVPLLKVLFCRASFSSQSAVLQQSDGPDADPDRQ